jgi:hypothetical protein
LGPFRTHRLGAAYLLAAVLRQVDSRPFGGGCGRPFGADGAAAARGLRQACNRHSDFEACACLHSGCGANGGRSCPETLAGLPHVASARRGWPRGNL